MKLNKTKKEKIEFDPARHWYLFLTIFSVINITIIAYAFYVFFYIKNEIKFIEIESRNSVKNSTSTDFLEKSINDNKFLKDINNLNKILGEYEKKELEYNSLINSVVKVIGNTSISIASNTVATSTQ